MSEVDPLVEKVGKEAIDAMRGALGDNPCVLDSAGERSYFSDKDLAVAFYAAFEKSDVLCKTLMKVKSLVSCIPELYMEDVHSASLAGIEAIQKTLKDTYKIDLTQEQEDLVYEIIDLTLESLGNGNYRHEH